VDWHQADLSKLFEQIRERFPASEAEKMVWAFERAFEVARVDEQLLEHLLVAAACLVAQTQDVTPRDVFEQFFRRSVSDDEWLVQEAPEPPRPHATRRRPDRLQESPHPRPTGLGP
jgi:hypothetical protein